MISWSLHITHMTMLPQSLGTSAVTWEKGSESHAPPCSEVPTIFVYYRELDESVEKQRKGEHMLCVNGEDVR